MGGRGEEGKTGGRWGRKGWGEGGEEGETVGRNVGVCERGEREKGGEREE